MKLPQILFFFLASSLILSCASVEKLEDRPIGLINNVSYKNPSFDNPNASNGFLVNYENKTYAITAKHILMIAKTDKMQFVDFNQELKEWRMHPKNDKTSYVVLDQLLNSNRKDSLTWDYMYANWDTYNDWLIFSIRENKTKHKPLQFRKKPLVKGEALYAIGWSYSDTTGAQRMYTYTFDKTEGNYHNLVQVKGPTRLGGLSGAPVVDERGELVGLVTSGGADEETKKIMLEVTSIKNMLEFLKELN
ncbi:MAG: trypsin-like peptidase domain-containing protein [Saprospiraceae bacterium]